MAMVRHHSGQHCTTRQELERACQSFGIVRYARARAGCGAPPSWSTLRVWHCVALDVTGWHWMAPCTALDGTGCHWMALDGTAWHCMALHGTVHGAARNGSARHCMALDGTARHSSPETRRKCATHHQFARKADLACHRATQLADKGDKVRVRPKVTGQLCHLLELGALQKLGHVCVCVCMCACVCGWVVGGGGGELFVVSVLPKRVRCMR
jgi:hypothetical protein